MLSYKAADIRLRPMHCGGAVRKGLVTGGCRLPTPTQHFGMARQPAMINRTASAVHISFWDDRGTRDQDRQEPSLEESNSWPGGEASDGCPLGLSI